MTNRFPLVSVYCLDPEPQRRWMSILTRAGVSSDLTASAPQEVSWRPLHVSLTTGVVFLRKVPPYDRSASCRRSSMAECTAAPLGSCCTAEWEKKKKRWWLTETVVSRESCRDKSGLTLLMFLGGGRLFVSLSASAPSSHGSKSFHCFSLKRLSTGTTWPSVVKMYLLPDLWSGLSSSKSCNRRARKLYLHHNIMSTDRQVSNSSSWHLWVGGIY